MKYKRIISGWLVLLFIAATNVESLAQCAMCKTSLESDMNNGGSIANGLNTGILYLMAIPYIVLMIGGYFFFRKQIDARVKVLWSKYFPAKAAK
jgi:hypothetical protein